MALRAANRETAAVLMMTDFTGQMNTTVLFPPPSFSNPDEREGATIPFLQTKRSRQNVLTKPQRLKTAVWIINQELAGCQ